MATQYSVSFDIAAEPVEVPGGTLLTDAAQKAGIEINAFNMNALVKHQFGGE